MLTIKVLGGGCQRCHLLEQEIKQALEVIAEAEPGLEATLQHVSDRAEYARYGLMFTPGLVINERLVSAGRVPSREEITGWLTQALAA